MNKRLLFLSMLSMIPAALYSMQKHKKKDFKKFSVLARKEQFSFFEYPYCISSIKQEPIQPSMNPWYYYKAPIAEIANKDINTTPNIIGARFYRNSNTYYKAQSHNITSEQQHTHRPYNNQINILQQVSTMTMQCQTSTIPKQSTNQQKNNSFQKNASKKNKKMEKIIFNTPNMLEDVARISNQKSALNVQQNYAPALQYLEQYEYPMNVYYYYATEENQENSCKFNISL